MMLAPNPLSTLLRNALVCACLIGLLALAPAQAADKVQAAPAATAPAANSEEVQGLKERVGELEARERQIYAMELERGRKDVDWWLSSLGIMLAGLAIFVTVVSIAIPYLIVKRSRNIINQDKKIIEKDKAQVREWLDEIERLKDEANKNSEEIRKKLEIVSGTPEAVSEDVQLTAKKTAEDETANPLLRLRAKAVEASRPETAQEAYTLWNTLAELDAKDANAQFNAGYSAQVLADKAGGQEKMHWLKLACDQYKQALNTQPDMLIAVNNWGWALAAKARESAKNDLAAARELWREASKKFQQTLHSKPDMNNVANNWGIALAEEAQALPRSDLSEARELWKQAGEKFRHALNRKRDYHTAAANLGKALLAEANAIRSIDFEQSNQLMSQAEQLLLEHAEAAPGMVAYALAGVYGLRGEVRDCLKWLVVGKAHDALPDCKILQNEVALAPVRNDPAFIEWFNQVCPS